MSCIKVLPSAKVFIQSSLQQEPGRNKPTKKSIILQPWGNSCENLQHYKPTEAKNKTGNFCTKLNFSSSPTSHRRARETQQQIQNLWVLFKNLGVKFLSSEQSVQPPLHQDSLKIGIFRISTFQLEIPSLRRHCQPSCCSWLHMDWDSSVPP